MKYITLSIIAITIILGITSMGLNKHEQATCISHAERLENYDDYYLTQSQFDMCMAVAGKYPEKFAYAEDDFIQCNGNMYLQHADKLLFCDTQ